MSSNSKAIGVINGINLVVSMGLLALGIVLIIYGFRIPDKKCDTPSTKDCLRAANNFNGKDLTDDVHTLRLVALITGFLLIIPFALNVTEMILQYVPMSGGISGFLGKIGSSTNQKSYTMRSRHHGGGY